MYNMFQVRHIDSSGRILDNYGQWAGQRDDGVRTKIGRFEDGGSYVLTVGQFLEDMYRPFSDDLPGLISGDVLVAADSLPASFAVRGVRQDRNL
jgi:hypothetical protein